MKKINRDEIQLISRHSNWSVKSIDTLLKQDIYSTKASWKKFITLFFISLGVGFTTSGIIFFFAYNWADLHKFIKIGLIEGLIVSTLLIAFFAKISIDYKNILLTGASILVGVLFAVFGQIYQTGANAYDFFLGWTLFIALWVAVSHFAPLWLVFIVLINTTIILYSEQVANHWSENFVFTILFIVNLVFLTTTLFVPKITSKNKPPKWFTNLLALATVFFSTIGISIGVFQNFETSFIVLIILTALFYSLGIMYGLKVKSGFYLSIIPFSLIIITTAFLVNLSEEAGMFFFISLFVVVSVTILIKNLLDLQKKWIN